MKKLERSLMNVLYTVTTGKNFQYFSGRLYLSKFDKCDANTHLHKVTGRNLTGHFFNRLITMGPKSLMRITFVACLVNV